jgi:hypothetical protein
VGPDGYTCTPQVTWFETVLPVGGTVSVLLDFQNLDGWYYKGQAWYDGPSWVLDGLWETPPMTGSYPPGPMGWPTGPYQLDFEAEAGQHVGLGVWSQDCFEGPGIADFHDLVFTPKPWSTHAAALDPRVSWTATLPGLSGSMLASVGDTNLDGVGDLAVRGVARYESSIRLLSGSSGSTLLDAPNPVNSPDVLAAVGDLDGDGRPDVAVGSPHAGSPGLSFTGAVGAVSGADGSALLAVFGTAKWDELGDKLVGLGDVDLDGVPDLAARLPMVFSSKSAVRILSGANGATLHELKPTVKTNAFGLGLAGAGDLTGDGVPDLLVNGSAGGTVNVVSGATGTVAKTFTGTASLPGFGSMLAPAGDVDGDQVPDFLAGCPSVGSVGVISGDTGSVIAIATSSTPGGQTGATVAGGTDFNGDGRLDLVAGAPSASPAGAVEYFDALDGHALGTLPGTHPHDHLGTMVAAPGDLDGDGLADVVALAQPQDSPLPARVQTWTRLDHPGPPHLVGTGDAQATQAVTVTLSNAQPLAPGFLVVGGALADLPFAGGFLAPEPSVLLPLQADATGTASLTARWPAGLPTWTTLWLQAWMEDPAGPAGFTATDAVGASQL